MFCPRYDIRVDRISLLQNKQSWVFSSDSSSCGSSAEPGTGGMLASGSVQFLHCCFFRRLRSALLPTADGTSWPSLESGGEGREDSSFFRRLRCFGDGDT